MHKSQWSMLSYWDKFFRKLKKVTTGDHQINRLGLLEKHLFSCTSVYSYVYMYISACISFSCSWLLMSHLSIFLKNQ